MHKSYQNSNHWLWCFAFSSKLPNHVFRVLFRLVFKCFVFIRMCSCIEWVGNITRRHCRAPCSAVDAGIVRDQWHIFFMHKGRNSTYHARRLSNSEYNKLSAFIYDSNFPNFLQVSLLLSWWLLCYAVLLNTTDGICLLWYFNYIDNG